MTTPATAPVVADEESEPTPTTQPAPPAVTCGSSSGLCAFITDISLDGDRYIADYATLGYEPLIPGEDAGATDDDHHVHFFFDTTAAGNAGENGNPPGSWELWGLQRGGGRKVFDAFTVADADCRWSKPTLCRRREAPSRGAVGRRPHRQLRRPSGVSGSTEMTMTSTGPADASGAITEPDGAIPPTPFRSSSARLMHRHQCRPRPRRGRATRVAICGAAGSGRTHLIEHARRDAERVSMRVLATHGRVGDGDIPYSSMLTLLHPVADRIPELPASERDSLQAALELRATDVDARAAWTGLWRLLTRLGDERPLLVTADDSDLMDDASLDVLAFALGRMDGQPVAALATADCHRSPNPLVAIGDELIVLDGLDAESLVRSVQSSVPATDWATRRMASFAGGNSALATQLVRSLTADQRAGRVACPPVPTPARPCAHADPRPTGRNRPAALVIIAADTTDDVDVIRGALRRRHSEIR